MRQVMAIGSALLVVMAAASCGGGRRQPVKSPAAGKIEKATLYVEMAEEALENRITGKADELLGKAEKLVGKRALPLTPNSRYAAPRDALLQRIGNLREQVKEIAATPVEPESNGGGLFAEASTPTTVTPVSNTPEEPATTEEQTKENEGSALNLDMSELRSARMEEQAKAQEEKEEALFDDSFLDEPQKQPEDAAAADADEPQVTTSGPGFDPQNVGEDTPEISNVRLTQKGPKVVMSFWFANKGKTTRIGRVSARFRNGADDLGGSMPQFYLAKDFKANWDDIFACEGRGYAAGTFQINQNKAVQLVLVANLRENENITNAQIQVILEDFRTIEHQENNL